MGKFVSVAAGTHRMDLGVNDGCSSDGLSGQSIDPAKARKQWQAAVRDVGGGVLAPEGAQKNAGFLLDPGQLSSQDRRQLGQK
jgi:hypothetical protein